MPKNNRERRRKFLKVLIWLSIPFIFLLATAVGYTAYLTNSAKEVVENSHHELDSRIFEGKSDLREKIVDPRVDNISVLFLGVDENEGENINHARTDAMILATFNKKDKSVKMVSIPRDSRVEIADRNKMDKITHAHAFGGIDMSVHTVENLFDLPVDYYVRLNFDAFISIVDTLGGVEIDVPFAIVEQDSERNNNAIHIEKGLQTLNGEEALAYARTRKYDNDIQRGERQQEVLKAIIQKGLSIESVGKYKRLLNDIGRNLTTNMEFDEMTAFHDYVYRGPSHMNIETLTLAGRDETIRGVYYYQINDEALTTTSQKLREHLELE